MLAIQPINISIFVIFLNLMSKLKEIIQKLIDQGFSEEEANKEANRLNKIDIEFERKLLSIKKFQKTENIEKIYSGDKYTIGDVIANIKSTLYKDPPGQERIFDKDFNLNSYINASLQNLEKTSQRLKQNKIRAKIIDPGDEIINEKNFKIGKYYYKRDVDYMYNLQIKYGKKPLRCILESVPEETQYDENYSKGNEDEVSTEAQNISMLHAQQEKENISISNQNDTIDALVNIINNMGDKCKNLLTEYLKRQDTDMRSWAIQRNEKYEKLKLDKFRCIEKLKEIISSENISMQNMGVN